MGRPEARRRPKSQGDQVKRSCGDCTLCCKLVPVKSLAKPANKRCQHQRHTGCAIYKDRPWECQLWSCRWLEGNDTADLPRPDRSRYVIDKMPDVIRVDGKVVDVVQVWIDPKHPEAWRDPAMMAYIERRAAEGIPTLIRYNSEQSDVVLAPILGMGEWRVIRSNLNPELLKARKERHGY